MIGWVYAAGLAFIVTLIVGGSALLVTDAVDRRRGSR